MTSTEKENVVWKTYPEYPFVQANQFGEIRTVDRTITDKNGGKRLVKGRVLKQNAARGGYLRVNISMNGKQIHLYVHRIVASCFLPNPDGLPEVNHKDNNPKNNSVENLEWCTPQYNTAYREKYGKKCNRPVFAVNLKTLEVSHFESQHEAARQLGVFYQNIESVLSGRYKQTGGYWFCNADENAVENTKVKFGDEVADKVKALMSDKS